MIDVSGFVLRDCPYAWGRQDGVALLQAAPTGSIDTIVTDPPYGIELALQFNHARPRSIAGDGRAEAIKLWRAWIPEAYRAARDDSLHLVFGTWKSPWMHRLLSRSFTIKGCIVWDKRIIGLGHYLRPRWEMAYLLAKGKPPKPAKVPADVWQVARLVKTQHPCHKPTELLAQAIRLTSQQGEIACDPFGGIASTGVAAVAEGRRFIGCEIDSRHAQLGKTRLEKAVVNKL